MRWQAKERSEHRFGDNLDPFHRRSEQTLVTPAVSPQAPSRARDNSRTAIIERMSEGDLRPLQTHPPRFKIDALEERRDRQQRMHGRADIVTKPPERELRSPAPPTGFIRALVNFDLQACASKRDRRCEAIRA